jgi:hypothetical protein
LALGGVMINIFSGRKFFNVFIFGLVLLLVAPRLSFAQASEMESLRALVKDMQQQLEKALSRIDQLEKEKANDSAKIGQVEKSVQAVQSAPSILNPAIGLVLDGTVEKLGKAGGNFNFRAAELGLAASVDPYARMYAFFTGSNDGVDVEEAAAITTSLPWNLTAKGASFRKPTAVHRANGRRRKSGGWGRGKLFVSDAVFPTRDIRRI